MARNAVLETLGQQLRYLREVAGVSLTETAQRIPVSKGYLSSVENGNEPPNYRVVEFYEAQFHGDNQAWSLYDAAKTANKPRQRSPVSACPPYPVPGDAATFIADVTVPDGTIVPPYFEFEKIWRVRNSGTVPWVGRWLARRGSPAGHGVPHSDHRVRIRDTQPGDEVDIAVRVMSQPLAGTSRAHWKMVDDDDCEYFPDRYPLGLVLTILVKSDHPLI